MGDMSRHDAERLHQLIANHARYTGSARAREILENWEAYLPKFRKVMPVEYRRALAELAASNAGVAGGGGVKAGLCRLSGEAPVRYTVHAEARMRDRDIRREWVERAVSRPEFVRPSPTHANRKMAFRRIEEFGNRWLHVVFEIEGAEIVIVSVYENSKAEKWR